MEVSSFGRELSPKDATPILDEIRIILQIRRPISKFIGNHPVSLSKENISDLLNEDYLVCEKSDGVRAMLIVYKKMVFLYDRKNAIYITRYIIETPHIYLFDGELYQEGAQYIFAIFDTLISNSEKKTEKNLLERLTEAYSFTRKLYSKEGIMKISNDESLGKFHVVTKQMTKAHGFHQVLDSINTLKHENDGLIFTPLWSPYVLESQAHIKKWKPPELNTVDFLIGRSPFPGTFFLFGTVAKGQLPGWIRSDLNGEEFKNVRVSYYFPPPGTENQELIGKIGEFRYDETVEVLDPWDYTVQKGGWVLHKIRTDKTTANNIRVILSVLDSIKHNIDEKALRAYWKPIYENYKRRSGKIETEKESPN